jgi:diguanylate cyclase (GGDEF)-like protein
MKCHSTPDVAPRELIQKYGDSKGFYEQTGDVRAIMSIKIPLETELYHAQAYYRVITLIVAISLLIIYAIIFYLMKKLDNKQKKLKELVSIDDLTKCYNRRSFEIDFNNEIEEARRNNTHFSLISFDIDHFKNINDTFGHQFGDTVLINICNLIKIKNRTYDKIYRVGGEEFMIFLPNTTLKSAIQIAQRIRIDVQEHKINSIDLTISLGVCQYTKEDTKITLYKKVDDALYTAKNNGRNRVEFCEEDSTL